MRLQKPRPFRAKDAKAQLCFVSQFKKNLHIHGGGVKFKAITHIQFSSIIRLLKALGETLKKYLDKKNQENANWPINCYFV